MILSNYRLTPPTARAYCPACDWRGPVRRSDAAHGQAMRESREHADACDAIEARLSALEMNGT